MKARFKGRKAKNNYLGRIIVILLFIVISFILTFKYLYNHIKESVETDKYIDYLVNSSFNNYDINDISRLSSMEFLLKYSFGIEKYKNGLEDYLASKEVIIPEEKPDVDENTDVDSELPLVYIYNSHQSEGYKTELNETFNINNTVFTASHILKEDLKKLGINSIVEEGNIVDILNTNGWKYNASYRASRILLENAYKDNSSLELFIDVHRDSSSYNSTTTEIDGIKYARLMFVVGLENEEYEDNLKLANTLNDKLLKFNKEITRGVLKKKGPGVNGVYNQDFNKNVILIEVGGQYNSIMEVNNTLKVLASIIFNYLKGTE